MLIAQVNENAPRTFGDGILHISQFDALVKADMPLPEMKLSEESRNDRIIGKLLADNLIEDGATLQLGLYPLRSRPFAPTSVKSSVYKPQLFFNLELNTSRVAPSPI